MGEIKNVVSNLVWVLKARQKVAEDLVDTMHRLQNYLDEESKNIVQEGLDRLLNKVIVETARLTGGSISSRSVVVLVSPHGRVTIKEIYGDENSDSWIARLKSEGFHVMRLHVLSSFIRSLKDEVKGGNLVPVIELLKENAEVTGYPDVSLVATEQPGDMTFTPKWKPSDFLPAPFPPPPLPRGLFRH